MSNLAFVVIICLVTSLQASPAKLFAEENVKFHDFTANAEQKKQLPSPDANLNIYDIPVGQGDCTVIQCPSTKGGKITIVDIGSRKNTGFSQTDVIKYLSGQHIEYLFLTHSDKDHVNYVVSLFGDLLANKIPYPPVYHSCPWSRYKIKIPNLVHNEITTCCPCNSMTICQGAVTLKILASGFNKCPTSSPNGDSIVMQADYNGAKVFLPGDFEGSTTFINNFLTCAGFIFNSPIMRLSHHGADNGKANTIPFLNAVSPVHAFSSSGLTSYGHPRCSLYNRLINSYPIATVASHDYTCYDSTTKKYVTNKITKAVYTTTIGDPKAVPPTYDNYVIQYAITSTGGISITNTKV